MYHSFYNPQVFNMTSTRLLLAALIAGASLGANAGVTVSPMAGFHWFDSDWNKIENDVNLGLGIGYRFDNGFGVELDGQQTKTRLLVGSPRVATNKVTNDILSVNGYYSFVPQNTVQPFVLLGAGQGKISSVSTDTVINLGMGTFVKLQENLSFRAEVRGVYNTDHSNVDTLALVGLQVDFGSKAKPVAVVEPTPIAVPFAPIVVVPVDDDKDGIINEQDNCPNTPQGVTVDSVGCPIDTDQDGVADYLDQCADTPLGALVDEKGCSKTLTEAIKEEIKVTFDTNKAIIKDEFKSEVAKVATLAKQYPTAQIEIQGYTDSSGRAANNQVLSQARADAVKDLLINGFNIDATRITANGYGSANPVADNKTVEGRAQNRRVIGVLSAETTKIIMVKPKAKRKSKSKR